MHIRKRQIGCYRGGGGSRARQALELFRAVCFADGREGEAAARRSVGL